MDRERQNLLQQNPQILLKLAPSILIKRVRSRKDISLFKFQTQKAKKKTNQMTVICKNLQSKKHRQKLSDFNL